jgi:hypothetical protein
VGAGDEWKGEDREGADHFCVGAAGEDEVVAKEGPCIGVPLLCAVTDEIHPEAVQGDKAQPIFLSGLVVVLAFDVVLGLLKFTEALFKFLSSLNLIFIKMILTSSLWLQLTYELITLITLFHIHGFEG